jgi:3-oxoacyl-[acyl-carrier-protein] synthase II
MREHGHRPAPIAITGIGAVSPAGWGVAAFRAALFSAIAGIGDFQRFDHSRHRTHIAGQVPAFRGRRLTPSWNRLSNSDRFALFAAVEACALAQLDGEDIASRSGVFFASSTGGLLESERYFADLLHGRKATRQLLSSHWISAPAETIAREFGVAGPVETFSSACAAGGIAIERAIDAIRREEVDVAICGGADCLTVTTYSGFNALRAVDTEPCRPFRANRNGLSLGEGAGVLILERATHAAARRARPLAMLHGAGSSCDAGHLTAPDPEGQWAADAIRRALADSNLDPSDIDFINAHGTATPLNDAAECEAIRRVFGDRATTMPVEATKALIGHLLGAAGAIEAVATVLTLAESTLHAAPDGGERDPNLSLDVVFGAARSHHCLRHGVSLNLGFGGANSAVVFGAANYPAS